MNLRIVKTENRFDFRRDAASCQVNITREFKALLPEVWAAWTEREILDKWWAPKPWKARTRSMVFKEGEMRHYAMVGPGGEEHWSFVRFTSVTPEAEFTFHDGFCDKEGNINKELPQSVWHVDFMGRNKSTIVTISIKYKNLSDLERMLEMGFKEGFTMALSQLDELLAG